MYVNALLIHGIIVSHKFKNEHSVFYLSSNNIQIISITLLGLGTNQPLKLKTTEKL